MWEQHEWSDEEALVQDAMAVSMPDVQIECTQGTMESPVQPSPTEEDSTVSSEQSPECPPPPHHPGSRRKFIAHSGTRDQVVGQLAGLRRKASMARV